MRSPVWPLLVTALLCVKGSLAQGGPPPHGIDPLATSHWTPLPGPKLGEAYGHGGNMPHGAPPFGSSAGASAGMKAATGGSGGGTGSYSQLQPETGFSGGPTNAKMYTYVPETFKKGNPVVVGLHHCAGTGPGYFKEYPDWPKNAEQKGFMMIFASSPGEKGDCWDVSSQASLKHDGGGDTQSIAEMIKYAVTKYGCSDHQVYIVGHSSGAMLTQALGATYPDIFLAGAAYSGVPAGCFSTGQAKGAGWNTKCAHGMLIETPQAWGQKAKDMYPGFKASYPRMMLVHGTQDQTINFKDHGEAVKQWTYLHNLNADSPTKKYALSFQPNYEVSMFGSSVMAIAADGVTHDNPAKVDVTCEFFGL